MILPKIYVTDMIGLNVYSRTTLSANTLISLADAFAALEHSGLVSRNALVAHMPSSMLIASILGGNMLYQACDKTSYMSVLLDELGLFSLEFYDIISNVPSSPTDEDPLLWWLVYTEVEAASLMNKSIADMREIVPVEELIELYHPYHVFPRAFAIVEEIYKERNNDD